MGVIPSMSAAMSATTSQAANSSLYWIAILLNTIFFTANFNEAKFFLEKVLRLTDFCVKTVKLVSLNFHNTMKGKRENP